MALAGILTPTRLAALLGITVLVVPVRGRPRDLRTRPDLPIGLLVAVPAAATYRGGHPTAPVRGLLTAQVERPRHGPRRVGAAG
ncbi:hypothetical protein [Streptomyces sp. bgisy027]|uniref:hypothetical protein n=1 Tax=Streptomyces sp. bgisy027 TaxID=3413770 RepID=UPI003D74BBE6